jgi:CDP-glycerol glycerophosphotransferase (TagB/SpsB family)
VRPAAIFCTNPFWYTEPAVVTAARKQGIPVLALIPSWDNLSTKSRMIFKYDGYVVWSEQARRELHHFYPSSRAVPSYVVGAPQFDVFFEERFRLSREAFCAAQGLRSDRPVIVYALGSPNFLREHHGALALAERVASGDLGDVQMIVRPHPIHDNSELGELFGRFSPRVRLQQTGVAGASVTARFQDEGQITEWVNTFRHADVVVNLSSTVGIDAGIFDRPVVNLDYDPEPGRPRQQLIKDINHLWTHFKPVAESGGMWLASDPSEVVEAVRTYLARPELHRAERRRMVEHVCGRVDGRSGERMARAVAEFTQQYATRRAR